MEERNRGDVASHDGPVRRSSLAFPLVTSTWSGMFPLSSFLPRFTSGGAQRYLLVEVGKAKRSTISSSKMDSNCVQKKETKNGW